MRDFFTILLYSGWQEDYLGEGEYSSGEPSELFWLNFIIFSIVGFIILWAFFKEI